MGNNLYDNLLKATSNIDDITTEKYGVITKLDGIYCGVKETDNDLEHNNVPILNGANLSVGDKVIIGFLNNSIYDVVCYGALDKTIHDDTKQDTLISGTNIKTINHQSLLGNGNITIEGGGTSVDIVTEWETTPSDNKVASEKLVKDSLDDKVDKETGKGLSTNDYDNTDKSKVDNLKTVATTGSYNDLTNKPSIPSNTSDLTNDSGFITSASLPTKTSDLTNDGADGTNVYISNNDSRLSDARTPTSHRSSATTYGVGNASYYGHCRVVNNLTKSSHTDGYSLSAYQGYLLKQSVDGKADSSHTHTVSDVTDFPIIPSKISDLTNDSDFIEKSNTSGLVKNDGTIDTTSYSTFDGDYSSLSNKPAIPSKTSDLTNDGDGTNAFLTQHQSLTNYIQKSQTSGLVKNDGTIDTTSYSTFSGSYADLSNKPTIPSASSTTPSADTTSGSYGSGTSYARSNHTHPKSSLYAESSHTHTKSQITDFPTIPSSSADLSDGSNLVKKSSTSGLIKNDGTIDTTSYLSSLPSHTHDDRYYTESEVDTALSGKQATLVSGTNIKTINNTSLLGSGNISIQGGGTVTVDDSLSTTSTNPVQNKVITGALNGKANSSHTHTKSEITDFPSIPSKTSDLVNDGDGSNVFVKDNDSRLSNARTPLAHTHLSSDVTDLIDVIYPVGSIYMSVNSTSPATLFGGTWEQIKDTFLLSSGDTYSNGATGGSATVSLSASQMPRHNHSTNAHSHSTSDSGEYFVTNTQSSANNTRVTYSSSGNRMVDGFNTTSSIFHHRADTDSQSPSTKYTGGTGSTEAYQNGSAHENMPPYIVVNVWKRTA